MPSNLSYRSKKPSLFSKILGSIFDRHAAKVSNNKAPSNALTAPNLVATFSVLVAGQRHEPLSEASAQFEQIQYKLQSLLQTLSNLFIKTVAASDLPYDYSPDCANPVMRIVTDAATDTDRMVHKSAKALGIPAWLLCQTTDLTSASSLVDFKNVIVFENSEDQFDRQINLSVRDELALSASDIVILVWDGDASRRRTDGIVQILRNAVLVGRPVIWIDNEAITRIITSSALCENIKIMLSTNALDPYKLKEFFTPLTDRNLGLLVNLIVDPIKAHHKHELAGTAIGDLKAYFRPCFPLHFINRFAGRIDKVITAILIGSSLRGALKKDSTLTWYGVQPSDLDGRGAFLKEPKSLKDRFEWSDRLANIAAGFHRDLTWLLYLFAALAVFSAIAGSVKLWPGGNSALWALIELGLICSISALVLISRKMRWHSEWLSNRFLAEQLRYTRAGLPFAAFQKPSILSPFRVEKTCDGELQIQLESAEQWILRRQLIEIALPEGNTPEPFNYDKHRIEAALYIREILQGQIQYHRAAHHRYHKLTHKLHRLTTSFFIVTFVAVVSHLFWHPEWLLLFTGALPAFAAAIHGVITQNELRQLELLSSSMVRELSNIADLIDEALMSTDSAQWLRLRSLAARATSAMSNVSEEWHDLIREREATLPA